MGSVTSLDVLNGLKDLLNEQDNYRANEQALRDNLAAKIAEARSLTEQLATYRAEARDAVHSLTRANEAKADEIVYLKRDLENTRVEVVRWRDLHKTTEAKLRTAQEAVRTALEADVSKALRERTLAKKCDAQAASIRELQKRVDELEQDARLSRFGFYQ